MPRSTLIKILFALSMVLAIFVSIYLYQQVPRRQSPFAKAVDATTGIGLFQGNVGIQLNKVGSGWRVHAVSESFPANNDKVKTFLSALKDVQLEDVISERGDGSDFEVNPDSGLRVVLLSKSSRLAEGVFGKQASDFTHIYFRFPGRPKVYLARNVIRGELVGARLNDWRDRTLIDFPEAQIQSVLIEGKGFTTTLERSSDTWTLGGKKIDSAPVYTLLGTLAHLKADEFVDLSSATLYGVDSLHWARITAKAGDRTIELRIGDEDKKNQRYPVSAAVDTGTAWLSESKVNALLLKSSSFHSK